MQVINEKNSKNIYFAAQRACICKFYMLKCKKTLKEQLYGRCFHSDYFIIFHIYSLFADIFNGQQKGIAFC